MPRTAIHACTPSRPHSPCTRSPSPPTCDLQQRRIQLQLFGHHLIDALLQRLCLCRGGRLAGCRRGCLLLCLEGRLCELCLGGGQLLLQLLNLRQAGLREAGRARVCVWFGGCGAVGKKLEAS